MWRRRGSCDLGCAATATRERGWATKCDERVMKRLSCEVRQREGERLSCDSATARGRDWDLRVWGFESDFWERQRRVRVEKWEKVSEEWFWERAERRRIGGEKKYVGAISEQHRLGEKKKEKKKRRSWTTSFKGWKSPNRPNRSRFTKPDGQTAVRTDPCFFRMERFLTLNRPWIWTVHGFSGPTVRSGPSSITLFIIPTPTPFVSRVGFYPTH